MPEPAPLLDLNDGNTMPAIGFGTSPMRGSEATGAVLSALEAGYRMIDTAARYDNEADVGKAVTSSGLRRDEVFLTTKLRGSDHGAERVRPALEGSLSRLDLDYVDLYLIHWPLPRVGRYVETWEAMLALQAAGLIRSVGVSNFTGEHIDALLAATDTAPAVNQVELHPRFSQPEQRAYDAEHGTRTQAWRPLGKGSDLLDLEPVTGIASRLEVTPAQVVLRWHVQRDSVPLPKSANEGRMRSNLDVFSFTLDEEQMAALDALNTGSRLAGDPDTNEEF